MRNLLDMNYNNNETFKLRWHLRFSYNDNKKTISSLNECIREISYKSGREIYEHLESINFPPEKLYEDMVYGLLFDYLNFEGIIRLIPFFMVEGVKCLYRLAYSIIKTIKGDLVKIKSADEILKNARERSKQINDISKLFNLSYTFKLTRYNNNYAFQEMPDRDLFFGKRNSYYLPSFSVCSYILKESEITKIWAILPQNIRMKDAKMIFNTQTNGYSLSSIYSLTDTYGFENEILFILETLNGEVIAGYMSNMFRHTNGKYQRPIQSLLITIRPNLALYESNKSADDIIYCENSYFMFGGGPEGAALVVDNNLKS
jgi:hypothetical protein